MTEESKASGTPPREIKRILSSPHCVALISIWLLTTVSIAIMLFSGVRKTGQFPVERNILLVAYVLAMFWYLLRTGPSIKQLPDPGPPLQPKLRIRTLIPVFIIALLFVSEFFNQGLLLLLLIPATIWILIVWRREIRLPAVLTGLAITAIAYLAGSFFYKYQYIGKVNFIIFLIFVMPMFIAGGLLSKHTGFVGSQLFNGRFRQAAVSFLWGCLLFIPLGLGNAASGSPGPGMTWLTRWWIPLSQPWYSGIVEEAWYRLFMVSLCFFLLRPAFSKYPGVAIVCSALFSAVTFGLGHGGTLQEKVLMIGLLYGLPLAVTFIKRDYEHAVGAHYMINMIPTLMVFLEN